MARPLRIIYPGAFYHLTCRGNERKAIYRDAQDRLMFLDKLQISLEIYRVRVHAYVLMNNHFHLIVETLKGNLSEFMRHFNISYTAAYNRRHNRVGHLYQGRFKAILIDADNYLLDLSRYLHLNPLRLRLGGGKDFRAKLKFAVGYRWSSLAGYLHGAERQSWVTYDTVLSYVGGNRKAYGSFVADGIRTGYASPWQGLTGQVVLGRESFVQRLRQQVKNPGSRREQPALRQLAAMNPGNILKRVARYFGLAESQLTGKRTGRRDERGLAMELMYRDSGVSQGEIGRLVGGLDYTAVSRERKRLRERTEKEWRLKKALDEINKELQAEAKL